MSENLFIAIEGGDGSGKGTQAKLLEGNRRSTGRNVLRLSFPRYGESSALFAEQYLNGIYGGVNDVNPDLASLAYAIDRFAAKGDIEQALASGSDVLLDRYVGSNLAHQGAKIADTQARHEFYKRILDLEYGTLDLPQPEKNIVLLVPPNISQENVDKKEARTYTERKRDIHEADANHLELAKRNYEELCELFPSTFIPIDCMVGDTMRSIEDIRAEIAQIVTS